MVKEDRKVKGRVILVETVLENVVSYSDEERGGRSRIRSCYDSAAGSFSCNTASERILKTEDGGTGSYGQAGEGEEEDVGRWFSGKKVRVVACHDS